MAELTREQLLLGVISGRGPAYLRGVDLSALNLSAAGWLVEADLRQANLAFTNLSRANLRGAILMEANLEGADLHRAKLVAAHLTGANLAGADLRGAALVGADLVRASLRGANLEKADLEGANLEGADLFDAKLNMANLKMAKIGSALERGREISGKRARGEGTAGFDGTIASMMLPDLLQLLSLSRGSMVVKVDSQYGKGKIHVCGGKVQHAETDSKRGEEALFEMLQWESGRFETAPLPKDPPISIEKPLEHLIIESMRLHDEAHSRLDGRHQEFIQVIKQHLPLQAFPSPELIEDMKRDGRQLLQGQEVKITDIFDSGNAGILCSIVAGSEIFIAPFSLLVIRDDHPLHAVITAFTG